MMSKGSNGEVKEEISGSLVAYEIFVKKSGIHFFYIISILVALLVVILTYNFSESKELVAYISFAATISSLILATFAIFYAVHSNSDLSKSFSIIKESADDVKGVTQGLNNSNDVLQNVSNKINETIKELDKKISSIPELINSNLETVHIGLNTIVRDNESIKNSVAKNIDMITALPSGTGNEISANIARSVVHKVHTVIKIHLLLFINVEIKILK